MAKRKQFVSDSNSIMQQRLNALRSLDYNSGVQSPELLQSNRRVGAFSDIDFYEHLQEVRG